MERDGRGETGGRLEEKPLGRTLQTVRQSIGHLEHYINRTTKSLSQIGQV